MRMRTACGRKKGAGSSAPFYSTPQGSRSPADRAGKRAVSAVVQFAVRRRDVDPHGAGQSTGGSDLIQIERTGRHAVEGPGEFPALHYELDDFPVVHVDPLRIVVDDDDAPGLGGGNRLAEQVGARRLDGDRGEAGDGKCQCDNGRNKRFHGVLLFTVEKAISASTDALNVPSL